MNQPKSPDLLHGPVDAAVVLAARARVLGRLRALSDEMSVSLAKLETLRSRIAFLEGEVPALEATAPQSASLTDRRRELARLQQEWATEAERARRQLATREHLYTEGRRILDATGTQRGESALRQWDTLHPLDCAHLAHLALTSGP